MAHVGGHGKQIESFKNWFSLKFFSTPRGLLKGFKGGGRLGGGEDRHYSTKSPYPQHKKPSFPFKETGGEIL